MNFLSDIITYVRRIIKSPSNQVITDALIIDYINRFYIMDMDARLQLFDQKTMYQFQTEVGFDQYNMPLYAVQTEGDAQSVTYYPMYQGFLGPAYINGIEVAFHTQQKTFFNAYPNVVQQMTQVATGNGGTTYDFAFPIGPNNTVPQQPPFQYILKGHVDTTGVIAYANGLSNPFQDPIFGQTVSELVPNANTFPAVYLTALDVNGNTMVVSDTGQFLGVPGGTLMPNYGLLTSMNQGPFGLTNLTGGYSTTSNTINYLTGTGNVTFPGLVAPGTPISAQCFYFQSGLPRAILFYNNTLTLRAPPSQSYLVQLEAYLSPCAFFATTQAIPFGYMAEYIARGAARKILSDTGDMEQFQFYEPLFREQEMLVWKRSQRQFTATRTQTLYSMGNQQGQFGNNNFGGAAL